MTPTKRSAPGSWSRFAPWIALLITNFLASALLGGFFYANRAMFWDNCKVYSIFRGNNHSLNQFGEVMWWNPTTTMGFPAYYIAHLGTNTFTPLSSLVLFSSWLLGRLGITITDYTHLYIIYFSFLVPLLFSVAVYLLARQIFRSFYLRLFVIIMAAFSPGVVFNYSDNGLEQTAYGVFFAAAFLNFYNTPGRKSFLWLVSASCMVMLSFNHLAMYWNVIFIPLFIVAVVGLRRRGIMEGLRRAWSAVPGLGWCAGAVVVALCFLPALISFSQGHDIVRSTNLERWYSFSYLRAGNPLEFLTTSTPGIGFAWVPDDEAPDSKWTVQGYAQRKNEVGYTYMGIMALPLLFAGLCFGRSPWRFRLLFLISVLALIILLEGWSSVFSAILVLPTPLRAVNHFCDAVFRVGMFFLVIFGSALGLEAVLIHRRIHRCALPVCFACSTLIGGVILIAVHGRAIVTEPLAGYFVAATALFMLHAFSRGRIQRNSVRRRQFVIALLVFVAVDVSTISYWHIRTYMWKSQGGFTDPPPTQMAMPQDDRSYYVQTLPLLMLRQNYDILSAGISGAQLGALPGMALFNHVVKMTPADARSLDLSDPRTLIVAPDAPGANEYAEFTNNTPSDPPKARSFELLRQTYNVMEVKLAVDAPAILFWRDCDFPGWHATVNGQPATIVKGFWSFKTVKVPAGESVVRFEYSQPRLLASLLFGYAMVIGTSLAGYLSPGVSGSRGSSPISAGKKPARARA